MDYETLRYEQDGHVVTLIYDRPDQHNAVNRTMNRELHHAWQRFRDDESAFVLVITGRRIGAEEAERIGLVNEIVPRGEALQRAQELAREIASLPQGAIRSDKESIMRGVGRTLEERLRIEAEMTMSMFMRRDSQAIGASAFKERRTPEWPHHGL